MLSMLSDDELVGRLPGLVQAERHAMADVIEHLVEVERRRLYLAQATSSLYRYCIDRLGYAEDAALKRPLAAQQGRPAHRQPAGQLRETAGPAQAQAEREQAGVAREERPAQWAAA